MTGADPDWLAPATLDEALAVRAERHAGATVLAGGTFLGILMNQGFLAPEALLSLGRVRELDYIDVDKSGELSVGAMTRPSTNGAGSKSNLRRV